MSCEKNTLSREEIKKRLTPGVQYLYINKTKTVGNKEHYTVIKTVNSIGGRKAAEEMASKRKTRLTGGSFIQTSILYNLESAYTVLECDYVEDEPSEKEIQLIVDVYQHIQDNFNDTIYSFVKEPIALEDLAFSKCAKLHYLATVNRLTENEAIEIQGELGSSLYGKNIVARGGWYFDYSELFTKFIVKTPYSLFEKYALSESNIRATEDDVMYITPVPMCA